MNTSAQTTIAQYDEMIAAGQFESREEHHVELLEGEITPMSPIGDPHEFIVDMLTEWSFREGPIVQITVRVQNSVGIAGSNSVPQPDLAWVRRRTRPNGRPQDSAVLLLIEVADSSLAKDRGRKARIYAQAGVADYWIVDVNGEAVEVRRDPLNGIYQTVRIYHAGDLIPVLAFPGIALPVAILFPPDTA